jgi:hypothetical protein
MCPVRWMSRGPQTAMLHAVSAVDRPDATPSGVLLASPGEGWLGLAISFDMRLASMLCSL